MSFKDPITIASAIKQIDENRYLLPAIQRKFEWNHKRIIWLFDSIMQGYPINSFLFWKTEFDTSKNYKFYKVLNSYRDRYQTHNDEFKPSIQNDFITILDGQQRLTSLYIGLKGSYAYKTPRKKWENSEKSIPTRHLYLNLSHQLEDQEDNRKYEFDFLKKDTTSEQILFFRQDNSTLWFKVSEIINFKDKKHLDSFITNNNLDLKNKNILDQLYHSICQKELINYYLEEDQELDKALNIFIRINSGGISLSHSDLLMSIAIANWKEKDARKEINNLVDNIRDKGFSYSKDYILRTFLFLYSKDIKFKVTNFSLEKTKIFEENWVKIRNCILSTFDLIKSFGFNDENLTSKNAVIPIVYYLYHKNIYNDFAKKVSFQKERETIKNWLHIVLINKVFSGTSDNTLAQIRKAFTNDFESKFIEPSISNFPKQEIFKSIKKDMLIDYENILMVQYGDKYAFSILSLLYPNLDYKNNNFDKDHLHPKDSYRLLSDDLKKKYGFETYNSILNLQMLDSNENKSKKDKELVVWVDCETETRNRQEFLANHLIPDIDLSLSNFDEFIEQRKEILISKLKNLIGEG